MKGLLRPREKVNLPDSLRREVNIYAIAASAAGVGLLATARPAEGKIVYTSANVRILGTYDLDLDHDGITDFKLNLTESGCLNRTLSETAARLNSAVGSAGQAAALNYGVRIGQGDHFLPGSLQMLRVYVSGDFSCIYHGRRGHWFDVDGYLGLKFRIHGKSHYGWARLTVRVDNYPAPHWIHAELTGYAYETIPGKSIVAGRTHGEEHEWDQDDSGPEASLTNPSQKMPQAASLGMLALGAQDMPLWRRKKEKEVEA